MSKPCKIVFLGDSHVGKTCMILRFVKGIFDPNSMSTVMSGMYSKILSVPGCNFPFLIWDTAGQEKYHSMATFYYKDAAAAIVVYDITSVESFEGAKVWIKEVYENNKDILLVLVGNKSDLMEEQKVDHNCAKKYANNVGAWFIITSAKYDINITETFEYIAEKLTSLSKTSLNDGEKSEERKKEVVRNKASKMKLSEKTINNRKKEDCC